MPQSFVFFACVTDDCPNKGVARMVFMEEGTTNTLVYNADVCPSCDERMDVVPNEEVSFE